MKTRHSRPRQYCCPAPTLLFSWVFCLLFFHGPVWADEDLSKVLDGIADRYAPLQGLVVRYEREVISRTLSMLGGEVRGDLASGRMFIKPPCYLRLEQESPTHEIIVTDGRTLRWYIPVKKEIHEYPAERFGQEMKFLTDLFGGLKEAKKAFRPSFKGTDKDGLICLELIPDPPWEQVDRVIVKTSSHFEIRSVEIRNTIGGITRFILSEARETGSFPADFFHLEVPRGVKVVREQ